MLDKPYKMSSLPSGNNTIGKIDYTGEFKTKLEAIYTKLDTLNSSSDYTDELSSILTNLETLINSNAKLSELSAINAKIKDYTTVLDKISKAIENVPTTCKGGELTSAQDIAFNGTHINFISNDGDTEVTINIKNSTAILASFKLKPDETFNDFRIKFTSISVSGTVKSVRYLVS